MKRRGEAGLLAICLMLAGGAGARGDEAETALRPIARPIPHAPMRPLARGDAEHAHLVTPAIRPGVRPDVMVEYGKPLRLAVLPAMQDSGEKLAVSAVLAVPPALLEGRVSTMGRPASGAHLAEGEHFIDQLFGPPPQTAHRPQAAPAVWQGPKPIPRPASVQAWAAVVQVPVIDTRYAPPSVLAGLSPLAVPHALRPGVRRGDFSVVVASARVSAQPRASAAPGAAPPLVQGAGLCGVATLSGRVLGSVSGPGACGVENAVEITSVGGIRLSPAVTVDCSAASAFASWVERVANPQVGNTGGGLARIELAGGYSCRGRNNVAGARLSEHAKGHAIDVMGFVLRDGSRLTVLSNWGNSILREMHSGACGIFGTVLGPNANAMHHNHFHFDVASYRAGAYCR